MSLIFSLLKALIFGTIELPSIFLTNESDIRKYVQLISDSVVKMVISLSVLSLLMVQKSAVALTLFNIPKKAC
jgi:hypothetical protein